eukprot:771992-Pyramimonas_sp.AAC.1
MPHITTGPASLETDRSSISAASLPAAVASPRPERASPGWVCSRPGLAPIHPAAGVQRRCRGVV